MDQIFKIVVLGKRDEAKQLISKKNREHISGQVYISWG